MNKLALLSSNVYHYVAIYHPMLICTKECFFIRDYAVEQRNLERAVINFSLFAYRTTVYKLLQSAINNFHCVGKGWNVH